MSDSAPRSIGCEMVLPPKRSFRRLPLVYALIATILLTLPFKGRWAVDLFRMISWPVSRLFERSDLALLAVYGVCQWAVIGFLLDQERKLKIARSWIGRLKQFLSSPRGLKLLKWALVLAFLISFALPADRKHELYGHPTHELYGWMIFVAVPLFLPHDLLSSYGEILRGDFYSFPDIIVPSLACIVWLSNFTAFFIRRKAIIFPLLAAHVIFAVFIFLRSDFLPAYPLWAFSIVGLHLLRLVPGRKPVPPPP